MVDQSYETTYVRRALTPLPYPEITGLKLAGDIRINGLTLNTIDANGVIWVVSDIEGWWNLPASEFPELSRGLGDGNYDTRGRWLPRDIVLTGSILPPSPDLAAAARNTLLNAITLVHTGGWMYVDESPTKSCYVRMVDIPSVTNDLPRGRIDFSIQLRAADPIKYGWNTGDSNGYTSVSLNTNGTTQVNASNVGTADVSATFSITGPLTQPAYINNVTTGKSIKIVKDLRAAGFTETGVSNVVYRSGVATVTLNNHSFLENDLVTISDIGAPFDGTDILITSTTLNTFSYTNPTSDIVDIVLSGGVATVTTADPHGLTLDDMCSISNSSIPVFNGIHTVTSVVDTTTFEVSMYYADTTSYGGQLHLQINSQTVTAGTVELQDTDTLELDTYNNVTLYRGISTGARAVLDPTSDWIKLTSGANNFTVSKTGGTPTVTVKYRPGWLG